MDVADRTFSHGKFPLSVAIHWTEARPLSRILSRPRFVTRRSSSATSCRVGFYSNQARVRNEAVSKFSASSRRRIDAVDIKVGELYRTAVQAGIVIDDSR